MVLGGDPALVPDSLVAKFAREVTDHWSEVQYGPLWRGLAPRILSLLERAPDEMLLRGLTDAHFADWRDEQRVAVREALCGMLARAVTGDRSARDVATLVGAAAHVDQDLVPWLDYLDTLGADADAGIARLARHWSAGDEPTLWWHPSDPAAPIRDWLYSDALYERLSRAGDQLAMIEIMTS